MSFVRHVSDETHSASGLEHSEDGPVWKGVLFDTESSRYSGKYCFLEIPA